MQGLKNWMIAATADQIRRLSEISGFSRQYLYLIATGRRDASAKTAALVEEAARDIRATARNELPPLLRQDICKTCQTCPYAAQRKKG